MESEQKQTFLNEIILLAHKNYRRKAQAKNIGPGHSQRASFFAWEAWRG